MGEAGAGLLTIGVLVLALAVAHVPFGDWMARVYGSGRHLAVERAVYRVAGVDPDAEQRWTAYALSLLGFSAVSVLFLYGFLRLQGVLPLSLGFGGVPADGAFNTAVSFVTNTNWQWYAGESTLGHLVQMAGLAVQNFLSAAVGMAVAAALVRGFARTRTDRIGNFWVDLVRGTVRILLPVVLRRRAGAGRPAASCRTSPPHGRCTLSGGAVQWLVGGPVASQEAIKELGTNGGGFFNANSAHPFENPNPFTNLFEVFLLLLIPFALPRTFGRMVGDTPPGLRDPRRHGRRLGRSPWRR